MLARGHRKETEKPPKLVCSGGRGPGDGQGKGGWRAERNEIGSGSLTGSTVLQARPQRPSSARLAVAAKGRGGQTGAGGEQARRSDR